MRDVFSKGIEKLPILMMLALSGRLIIFIRYSQTYVSLFAFIVILGGIVGDFFTQEEDILTELSRLRIDVCRQHDLRSGRRNADYRRGSDIGVYSARRWLPNPRIRRLLAVLMTGAVIVLS